VGECGEVNEQQVWSPPPHTHTHHCRAVVHPPPLVRFSCPQARPSAGGECWFVDTSSSGVRGCP